MSTKEKIKRFWYCTDLEETSDGDYVEYDDYEELKDERDKLRKALDLALYYIEGDSTYESLKHRIEEYLAGKTEDLK